MWSASCLASAASMSSNEPSLKTAAGNDRRRLSASSGTAMYLPWRPVTPRDGESVRWECVDGRWIAIGLATGKRAGFAFVYHSGVLCEYVETYEQALALAKKWRTI
jgi:hypothetical protein